MTEPSIPAVRAARRSLEIFQKLNFLVSPDRVRLIVNRRGEQSAISVAQIEETLGMAVFGTITNDYLAVSTAINVDAIFRIESVNQVTAPAIPVEDRCR